MAFVREIGRNDVLYSGIRPRHRVSNHNKGISMTSINKCALRAHYGVSNRIESNRKIYQFIESIKFHINDITS